MGSRDGRYQLGFAPVPNSSMSAGWRPSVEAGEVAARGLLEDLGLDEWRHGRWWPRTS